MLADYESDDEDDDDDTERGQLASQVQHSSGPRQTSKAGTSSSSPAPELLKDLHSRCVSIVMELVSEDEGDWDSLLMWVEEEHYGR